ncbi:MAG: hypothetical protein LBV75_08200 [Paludibacter sp.]|jgi:hypothetical protein|nr:hypothetical protein [Paludibacter sp.]
MNSSFIFKPFLFVFLSLSLTACAGNNSEKIDRYDLVQRNSPIVKEFEELSSLSVGNGNFAFTVDATGLQTFPELYQAGVSLGTQSQWGWHSFPNTEKYLHSETLKNSPYHNPTELYATQFNKDDGRPYAASNYFRENPHRIHLGYVGLELISANGEKAKAENIKNVYQRLDLWTGIITSKFEFEGDSVTVKTSADPNSDKIAVSINSSLIKAGKLKISLHFPYPTGKHTDDASDFTVPQKHSTALVNKTKNSFNIERTLDTTRYYVTFAGSENFEVAEKEPHYIIVTAKSNNFAFTCEFKQNASTADPKIKDSYSLVSNSSSEYWKNFWEKGAVVDFSQCTDDRAKELERRVVLSQYLTAIQCAGNYPPQETGLTFNSWYGKYHLEMHWWHAAHFPLWNHADLLERSMDWYNTAAPIAKQIAERQGFKGIRWMKMTDPTALEAPSKVGSFLIWQQPHFIYFAELLYRNNPSPEIIAKYAELVNATAEFMASFATYDELEGRYVLKGIIAAQETLRASETVNPPFELSYWHYAMQVAQMWRERAGLQRKPQWDELIDKLSPLTATDDMEPKLYLASENAVDTYKDIRFTSDHPAVLGAVGILPQCKLVRPDYMKNTLEWVWDNWNWGKTWGWDYPMVAMCAARLGEPEKAVGALLMNKRTNTYLVSGHNYQDSRLRIYLPGNGGLLTAVAMMCAGWDGCSEKNPGFPKDGKWNVRWEGLKQMP